MKTIYVTIFHDRHTDDTIQAFQDIEVAKEKCQEWVNDKFSQPDRFEEKKDYYGNWCLFRTDDYYASVEAVELQ